MKLTNRVIVGVVAGLICLPLVSALAGAANVEATWRTTSEDGIVSFSGYGYGGGRPDGQIRVGTSGPFVGNDVFNTSGTGQTASTTVGRGGTATFTVRLGNDGSVADQLRVFGVAETSQFRVSYFAGTTDISVAVRAGTYTTAPVAAGGRTNITVVVKAKAGTPAGAKVTVGVTVASTVSPAEFDQLKAKVRRV